jgi:hypothetical protein
MGRRGPDNEQRAHLAPLPQPAGGPRLAAVDVTGCGVRCGLAVRALGRGWLSAGLLFDRASRRTIGWALSESLEAKGALPELEMAWRRGSQRREGIHPPNHDCPEIANCLDAASGPFLITPHGWTRLIGARRRLPSSGPPRPQASPSPGRQRRTGGPMLTSDTQFLGSTRSHAHCRYAALKLVFVKQAGNNKSRHNRYLVWISWQTYRDRRQRGSCYDVITSLLHPQRRWYLLQRCRPERVLQSPIWVP